MVDNIAIASLPLPEFAKVRYSGWQLDELTPATENTKTTYFLKNTISGIEVSGQSTTYQHLSENMIAQGVIVMGMKQAQMVYGPLVNKLIGSVISKRADRLSAQNYEQFNTGIFVYIPDQVKFDDVRQRCGPSEGRAENAPRKQERSLPWVLCPPGRRQPVPRTDLHLQTP